MSEYTDSLQNYQVVKDAVSINAATECNRLAVENRRMAHKLDGLRRSVSLVVLEVIKIDNVLNPKIKDGK